MSLGLIQPGASVALRHPKTGAILSPLYVRKNGQAVWPVLGASPDDPDDPTFTGGDDDDDSDDDDSEEDDEEDEKPKSKKKAKSKKDDDDEDEDDEDEEDHSRARAFRQAKKYRLALRAAEAREKALDERLKAIENKDKPKDEVVARELDEVKSKLDKATARNRDMTVELAFFKANTIEWIDPADALRLIDLDDVDVDEDGTVDAKALRAALRDLAKRKPHLVKKPKPTEPDDDEDDDEEEDERPRRSARTANGRRKGSKGTTDRAALAKKFPVLQGM